MKHQILLSTISSPSLLYVAASCFDAIAIPTALEIPCPRGPVVTSIPAIVNHIIALLKYHMPGYSISGCPAAIDPEVAGE